MIEIAVFKSKIDMISGNCVFREQVELHSSLEFPFNKLMDSFRALYGNPCFDFKVID